MAKSKLKLEISPKGIFVYPCLNRPDTKFDSKGIYSVKLKLSAEDAAPLVEQIDQAIDTQVKKIQAELAAEGKKPKVKRADAPYAVDNESGDVIFNFKQKAQGERKDGTMFTQRPGLKSSEPDPVTNQPMDIPEDTIIGGGSIGKVAFNIAPFYTALIGAGITLRLRAVQVFKLVEPSYSYGFEAEAGPDDDDYDGQDASGDAFSPDTDTSVEAASGADF